MIFDFKLSIYFKNQLLQDNKSENYEFNWYKRYNNDQTTYFSMKT